MTAATLPVHLEQFLPESLAQWQIRIRDLIAELRSDSLKPGYSCLYAQQQNGPLLAGIEGVINEMAIRGGVPACWAELEIDDTDDEATDREFVRDAEFQHLTIWEVEPPPEQSAVETTNRAIAEALYYHGFDLNEGALVIDVMDCDMNFVRTVVNDRHGVAFGADTAAQFNDKMLDRGANPLHLMADLLEHLLERPCSSLWHPRVSQWTVAPCKNSNSKDLR